jgi:hypothetical protein
VGCIVSPLRRYRSLALFHPGFAKRVLRHTLKAAPF